MRAMASKQAKRADILVIYLTENWQDDAMQHDTFPHHSAH
jgi:hypothetical protein